MNDNDESIIEDTVDDDLQQRNKKEESKLKSQIKKEGKKHENHFPDPEGKTCLYPQAAQSLCQGCQCRLH